MAFSGTTQGELRTFNEQRILEWVRDNPRASQQAIASGVKLTRAAVAKLLGPEPGDGDGPTNLRRVLQAFEGRPVEFSLKAELGCVMAVDVGSHHVRVRVADLAGATAGSAESTSPIGVSDGPTAALDATAALMVKALNEAGYTPDGIAGVAIGVPFPVDDEGGIIASNEWRHAQLPTALWERLSFAPESAAVESDATLGAIAEFEAALRAPGLNLTRERCDLVYLKWSSLITAALVSDGEVHRGHRGMAGAFAHTPIAGFGPENGVSACPSCGRFCLNAVASLNAIVENVEQAGEGAELRALSAEERARTLVAQARAGNTVVAEMLDQAAINFGRAIGPVLNMLNPRVVIVGGAFHRGEVAYLTPAIIRGVEETAYKTILDDAWIQPGRCTGAAAVDGGIAHALRKYAVEHLLGYVHQEGPVVTPRLRR